ncbi:MAG: DUF4831 family protein, partial [Desulfobacterales bacterium]|nr:DUF4831 family protein [Desulfobacterales bacterium]
ATDSAPPAFGKKCGARKGDGLVYRLPQSGLAYVTREKKGTEKKRLASARVSLPQFGQLVSLPNCFHKRKTTLNVTLSSSTGMLQSIMLTQETQPEEDTLQTNLDALGTATEALAGAVAQDPELKALENEKALLEAQKDKLEAERQLNCYRQTSEPCSDE